MGRLPPAPLAVNVAPFNRPDVDILLRTSDNVDLGAHKFMLSMVSPLFAGMFMLPQPQDSPLLDSVTVHEDSSTMILLLRSIYPFSRPTLGLLTPEVILELDRVARKFEIKCLFLDIRKAWVACITEDPLQCWAAAYRKGPNFEDKATEAANQIERFRRYDNFWNLYRPEFNDLSADAWCSLLEKWFSPEGWGLPDRAAPKELDLKALCAHDFGYDSADFIFRVGDGDEPTCIPLRRDLLRIVAPKLADFVDSNMAPATLVQGLPVVGFPSSCAAAAVQFIKLFYPCREPEPVLAGYDMTLEILQLAKEYDIPRVISHVKRILPSFRDERPLGVYLTAAHEGWTDVAYEAMIQYAVELCAHGEQWNPERVKEMSYVSARHLNRVHRLAVEVYGQCPEVCLGTWVNEYGCQCWDTRREKIFELVRQEAAKLDNRDAP